MNKRKAPDYSNEINELLKGRELSLDEIKAIAFKCEISPSAVYSWVRGNPRKSPSAKNMEKFRTIISDGNFTVNNGVKVKEKEFSPVFTMPASRFQLPGPIADKIMDVITKAIVEFPGAVAQMRQEQAEMRRETKEMKALLEEIKKGRHHCPDCHGS